MVVGDVEVVGNAVIQSELDDLPYCFGNVTDDVWFMQFGVFAGDADVQRADVLKRAHF